MVPLQIADGQRKFNLKLWISRESTSPYSILHEAFRYWLNRTWNQFAAALARAYNDWLWRFLRKEPRSSPRRRHGLAFDIDEAVVEVKRCVKEL